MKTIVTHTYSCLDCYEETHVHLEDGVDVVDTSCQHCGSTNLEKE